MVMVHIFIISDIFYICFYLYLFILFSLYKNNKKIQQKLQILAVLNWMNELKIIWMKIKWENKKIGMDQMIN